MKQQTDVGNLNGYIEEMMEGQKVVKVFCHEQAAQEEFISIMLDGFSQEEIDSMKEQNDRILRNINTYLKGKEAE